MSNKLVIGTTEYEDATIMTGAYVDSSNGMVSDELSIDTLSIELAISTTPASSKFVPLDADSLITSDGFTLVISGQTDSVGVDELLSIQYAQPMTLYHDGVLVGKFYHKELKRTSKKTLQISAQSVLGVLDKIPHVGGIYDGETAGDVITELMSGYPVTIDDAVARVTLYGWLPYATCRENLHQVLFAIGASVYKDSDGEVLIKNMSSGSATSIPDSHIYLGGKVTYNTQATEIDVTEHAYYALDSDETTTLFDNTSGNTASHQLVTFSEPCHNLVATGITIEESGVNYAIVTGTGTLTGQKYTHTTQVIEHETGVTGESQVVEVQNATLVSALNSQNVAKRLGGYYSAARSVEMDVIVDSEAPVKAASEVSFTDPYGEVRTGYVKDLNLTLSKVLKGSATIDTDWTPSHFGNNYNGYAIVSESGTVTVPSGVDSIRAILIGGGQGGQGGESGDAGSTGGSYSTGANGGSGGDGGTGGSGGKVYAIDLDLNGATTFVASIGTGGAGGSAATEGSEGADTTITLNGVVYSSASGQASETGAINPVTGENYGLPGGEGIAGGDGAGKNTYEAGGTYYDGESVTYDGVTYAGGGKGAKSEYDWSTKSGTTTYTHTATAQGGSGGGACATSAGSNGSDGSCTSKSESYCNGGTGGAGASPTQRAAATRYGCGGDGGHGGGGGGVGGSTYVYEGEAYQPHSYSSWGNPGRGGAGGTGGKGGDGAPGCIIYLY